MLTTLYFLFSLALLAELIATFRLRVLSQARSYWWLLLIVLFGLFYDNFILAIGSLLGEGDLLKSLSVGRYVGHALGTPLLVIFVFGVARRAGLGWAQAKLAHALICLFTTVLIGFGVFRDIVNLEMAAEPLFDVIRYSNVGPKGPPISSISTILAMIFMGVLLWHSTGWKWLAIGSIFMFIAAAVGMGERIFISNLGEVVLGWACLASARGFLIENNK